MKAEKKFFFSKGENVAKMLNVISNEQLIKITGGDADGYTRKVVIKTEGPVIVYTESTYVRR